MVQLTLIYRLDIIEPAMSDNNMWLKTLSSDYTKEGELYVYNTL